MRRILIGIAFLSVITLMTVWVMNNQSTSTIKSELTDFSFSDTASITKISLEDEAGQLVILERTSRLWTLNSEYEARPDAIQNLLTTISRVSVKSPVSQQGMNTILKNIISNHTLVKIYTGGEEPAKSYYVGGPDQTHTGTMMLMKGSSRPFITHIEGFHGFLTPRYFTNVLEWRHRGVFEETIENIQSVSVEFPESEKNINISRNSVNGFWQVSPSNGAAVDTFLLMAYLKKYEMIHYESYEETKSEQYLDSIKATEPIFRISLTSLDGTQTAVTGFRKPLKEGYDPDGNEIDYDLDRLYLQMDNGEMVIGQYAIFDPLTKGLDFFR